MFNVAPVTPKTVTIDPPATPFTPSAPSAPAAPFTPSPEILFEIAVSPLMVTVVLPEAAR